MELEWKDSLPPERRGGAFGKPPIVDWWAVARELKARPRQWALVATNVYRTHASRINSGANAAFRDGLYEASCRSNKRREDAEFHRDKGDLYVRYLGPWGAED